MKGNQLKAMGGMMTNLESSQAGGGMCVRSSYLSVSTTHPQPVLSKGGAGLPLQKEETRDHVHLLLL